MRFVEDMTDRLDAVQLVDAKRKAVGMSGSGFAPVGQSSAEAAAKVHVEAAPVSG